MNIREVHEIIQQISETLTCPRCKARILPQHIRVAEIHNNGDYLFDVECKRCDAEMSLSAHVERVASSPQSHAAGVPALKSADKRPPITQEDVVAMQNALKNFCGSFIQAFS
ncbi:hypothetical protein HZA43_02560 [Candidatus Peregrinibacteria bacterium]|nr:hypothetical protein [Candidatus Peregrinibacteria bacterium]